MASQSCCRALLVTHGCPSWTPGRRLRARTGRVRCGSSTEARAAGHLHAGQGRPAGRTRLPRHGILPGHPPRPACATEGLSSLVPPPCALANTVSSPRARRRSQANVVMDPRRQPRRIATSRAWSATSFFSRVFSGSSSLSRRVWSTRRPPYFSAAAIAGLLRDAELPADLASPLAAGGGSTSASRSFAMICSAPCRCLPIVLLPSRPASLSFALERSEGGVARLRCTCRPERAERCRPT
jgi:hypothetical protein